ncbi:MAG: hypothetical protein IAF38_12650, partial [Bacteroidia bacterium]|nr:hypothetical protein [Bacteroidia bacterium]
MCEKHNIFASEKRTILLKKFLIAIMKYFSACIFLVFSFAFCKLNAQKNFFKEAMKAYKSGEYYLATSYFKKSYEKAKNAEKKAEALFCIGDCYRRLYDYNTAAAYFAKSIKAKYPDPMAQYYLAYCQKAMVKYYEAVATYKDYLKQAPSADNAFPFSCELAQKWKDNPTNYQLENMAYINSKSEDRAVVYAGNDSALYYISTRVGSSGDKINPCTGMCFSDIYFSAQDSFRKWYSPVIENKFFNSDLSETSINFDPEIPLYYFTRIVKQKIKKKEYCWKEKIFCGWVITDDTKEKKKTETPRFCNGENKTYNFTDAIRTEEGDLIFS